MNPERLLEHFDRLSEAPDAIPRLRRLFWIWPCAANWWNKTPTTNRRSELLKRIQVETANGCIKDGKDEEGRSHFRLVQPD